MVKFWGCIFAFGCSLVVFARAQMDGRCMECICQSDSKCQNIKCQKEQKRFDGRRVCGFYKLSQRYFDECGNPGRRPKENKKQAWERCAQDKVCAGQCVVAFAAKHEDPKCIRKRNNETNTCEMMARNHFGGPGGCRKGNTNQYWKQVKQCLDRRKKGL